MRAVDVIRKKRDGHSLSNAEIAAFVYAATHDAWPDYQLAALLMAIVCRGMNGDETSALTGAMVDSGVRMSLADVDGVKVDKHSTGGVGDKTSLILAPLAAACGVIVPMMSGRGLGHTGGTLDKLESIPGFRVHLPLDEFRAVLRELGCCMIGQTHEIAPADRKLYALRDVTGTVESIPLISASIMSKKIAEGIDALVLDVKCGHGAFMKNLPDARALAQSLHRIGHAQGVRTEAVLTSMDTPLGRAAGNSLEIIESVEVLRGNAPGEVETLSVHLAARMVRLAGIAATLEEAEKKVREALTSGRGLEKFRAIIERQGGDARIVDDYRLLPIAEKTQMFRATRSGIVSSIHAERIGIGSMILGAGRERAEHKVDHSVGVVLHTALGRHVKAGESLLEIHYNDPQRLQQALPLFEQAFEIGDNPSPQTPLILDTLEAAHGA